MEVQGRDRRPPAGCSRPRFSCKSACPGLSSRARECPRVLRPMYPSRTRGLLPVCKQATGDRGRERSPTARLCLGGSAVPWVNGDLRRDRLVPAIRGLAAIDALSLYSCCVASPASCSVRWAAESAERRRDDPYSCWPNRSCLEPDLSPAAASLRLAGDLIEACVPCPTQLCPGRSTTSTRRRLSPRSGRWQSASTRTRISTSPSPWTRSALSSTAWRSQPPGQATRGCSPGRRSSASRPSRSRARAATAPGSSATSSERASASTSASARAARSAGGARAI